MLLQIIAEHEQNGEPMLSTQLLSQIIRFYGDSLQGFMGSYLERSMQIFLEQQQQFRSRWAACSARRRGRMMNQLTERNMEMWKEFQQNLAAASAARRREAEGHEQAARKLIAGIPRNRVRSRFEALHR